MRVDFQKCPKGSVACLCLIICMFAFAGAPLAQNVIISEFMALNSSTLKDEDGAFSDWLELANSGSQSMDLQGWYLTDDRANLTKWMFPKRILKAGEFLVVFASGKDRKPETGNLHTNFKLNGAGGYLALVESDGRTVHGEYAAYPSQKADFSYGARFTQITNTLVGEGTTARILIPTNNGAGLNWTGGQEPFDDSDWITGLNGVGYQSKVDGFMVSCIKANNLVWDIGMAEEVLATPSLQAGVVAENCAVIDYFNTADPGHYTVDRPFPGTISGVESDDFVVLVQGQVTIPSPGDWTFGVMSDDGFGLEISRGDNHFAAGYSTPRSMSDTLAAFTFPEAGEYDLRLVFFQNGGGAGLELFAAAGAWSAWDSTNFHLVGDVGAGGLAVRSLSDSGLPGVSFSDFIHTDLRGVMENLSPGAFVRIPFTVADPGTLGPLFLQMRYNDGFVAWLNGTEIARQNAPDTVAFDSTAATNRPPRLALEAERINVSAQANTLKPGVNILSIHGLNDFAGSPDFLQSAVLESVAANSSEAGYFYAATPGQPNTTNFMGFVEAPKFSVWRGFFQTAFDLSLNCATPGATIRYTTNGNAPTAISGLIYTNPIPVTHTMVLRAAAFRTNWNMSRVETHSYVFLDDVIQQKYQSNIVAGFPTSWNGVSPDYGMDPRVVAQNGTDRYGGKYAREIRDDLKAIPTMSIVMNLQDMFGVKGIYSNPLNRGAAWERPISVEIINGDGSGGFQENAGLSVQGGAFRDFGLTKKKSFRLLFKSMYGAGKMHYPFFGPNATDQIDSLTLRANNNDGYQWDSAVGKALYLRDAFAHTTAGEMGMAAAHTAYVHLYINGFYWGLYNPVERPDAAFASTYLGGQKENWDAINQDSAPDGNYSAWNRMIALANSGLANKTNYQRIQGNNPDGTRNPAYENLLDVDNMIDYMIVNFYAGNTDWPHRNWYAARDRTGGEGFRFFPWDTEAAMDLFGADINIDRTSVSGNVATPYASAKANPEFRMKFADHVYRHFFNGGVYYVDPQNAKWDPAHPERNRPAARFASLAAKVEKAVVGESARWGDQHVGSATLPYTRDEHWAVEKTNLLNNWFPRRSAIVLQQFKNAGLYPRTDPPLFNQRGGRVPSGFQLTMTATNGVIYYTTNGLDPRGAMLAEEVFHITLAGNDAPRKILVPSQANGGASLGTDWRGGIEPFDDSTWTAGTGGVGYDRDTTYLSYIQTDVKAAMDNKNGSVFIRIPFYLEATNRARLNTMTLRVRYDDGFVAFLNGVKITSANEPAALTWDAFSSAQNSDSAAVNFEDFPINSMTAALKPGVNILAIQGLNLSLASTDFLLDAELVAGQTQSMPGTNAAMVYTQAVVLSDFANIKARVLNGTEWSALNEARFIVGSPALTISEVHYHPMNPNAAEMAAGFTNANDFEFIELKNAGAETYDLTDVRLVSGIQFAFAGSAVTRLAPGGYVLVVMNKAAFEMRYGADLPVAGEYSGKLGNAGEHIVAQQGGDVILDFTYGTNAPWPASPDGFGASLEIIDPDGDLNSPLNWRASYAVGGSPGRANPGPVLIERVLVNGSQLQFRFNGRQGAGYTIYACDSLSGNAWRVVKQGDTAVAEGPIDVALDLENGVGQGYYRVSVP